MPLVSLALIALTLAPGLDDRPKPGPAIEPEARKRLDALTAAYQVLPAYSDQGTVTIAVKVGDQVVKRVQKARVSFVRPGKLDVETDLVRLVTDGSSLTTAVAPLRKFLTTPAPKVLTELSFRGGPLGAIEFGGVAGLPLAHVLNLVIGREPERLVFDYAPKLIAEPDQVIDGQTFQALRLDQVDNFDWLFLIDPKTHLLSYVDLVVDPEARKTLAVESIRWASGAIATEPIKDEAFTFQPPAGFTKVASLSEAVAKQAEAPKPAPGEKPSLVGKPAPDFTLDALDGPDSFRKVTKASLAGKVVLIDFWATWCGPCLEEMPGIQKLIEAYSKEKKDVVVVALSIDQAEAGDLKEARGMVEATLKERKFALTGEGHSAGLVALDPLGKLAELYGVQAIPFVVILDREGVVRHVHLGLTEAEVFTREIDALLETAKK